MSYSQDVIYARVSASKELADKVDKILDQYFQFENVKSIRLPRGWVHDFIAERLKLKLNNKLCLMIRDRALKRGVRIFTNTSKYYYGNIRLKGE